MKSFRNHRGRGRLLQWINLMEGCRYKITPVSYHPEMIKAAIINIINQCMSDGRKWLHMVITELAVNSAVLLQLQRCGIWISHSILSQYFSVFSAVPWFYRVFWHLSADGFCFTSFYEIFKIFSIRERLS